MDWIGEPAGQTFVKHVLEDMAPKMAESALCMSLVPDGELGSGDVKFWVETGAAICMDKPILLIVPVGAAIPPKLEKVADKVIYLPEGGMGPEVGEAIARAVKETIDALDEGEGEDADA